MRSVHGTLIAFIQNINEILRDCWKKVVRSMILLIPTLILSVGEMPNKGSESAFLCLFDIGLVMGKNHCHNITSSSFAGKETCLQ